MMGNYPTKLSYKQTKDTGIMRRLNVKKLTGMYTKDIEKDVKAEIGRGVYNQELFWLFRVFYTRYVSKLPVNSTRVHPRPPALIAETDELFNTAALEQVKDWLEEYTVPAASYGKASNIMAVKHAVAKVIGYDYQPQKNDIEFSERLRGYGLDEGRNGTVRIMTYLYPDTQRRKGVKLITEVAKENAINDADV